MILDNQIQITENKLGNTRNENIFGQKFYKKYFLYRFAPQYRETVP